MHIYTWRHWFLFFYFYCFFGWVFESVYVSLCQRRWINRGFLHLPLLPIYGFGAIMMLWISLPVRNSPPLIYLTGVISATALEYAAGYVMEKLFKVKYWDYSNHKYNMNGYICLSSSVVWGFLSLLMTEVLHHPVEKLVFYFNPISENIFLAAISVLFLADTLLSVREALNLSRALEAVTRLRIELDSVQAQLSLLKEEASHLRALPGAQAAKFHKLGKNQLVKLRKKQKRGIQIFRKLQKDHIHSLNEKLIELQNKMEKLLAPHRHGILHRNPSASSRHFSGALKELREAIERKNRKNP